MVLELQLDFFLKPNIELKIRNKKVRDTESFSAEHKKQFVPPTLYLILYT